VNYYKSYYTEEIEERAESYARESGENIWPAMMPCCNIAVR
jgi:hypothetical protein